VKTKPGNQAKKRKNKSRGGEEEYLDEGQGKLKTRNQGTGIG